MAAIDETKFLRIHESDKRTAIERLRLSTILDDILKPVSNNSTEKGYYRAIKGLMESNESEVLAGCAEEMSEKGQYRIECQMIFVYVSNLYTINRDTFEYIMDLIEDRNLPLKLIKNAWLCFAYFSMAMCINYIFTGVADKAEDNYKNAFKILSDMEEHNAFEKHKIYVIKSGVLQGFTSTNAHKSLSCCAAAQIRHSLEICCKLMPNFYHAHKQCYYEENHSVWPCMSHKKLKQLCDRFPHGIAIRSTYIIELALEYDQLDEAKRELIALRAANPDRIDETWWVEGVLNDGKPESVNIFKRAIAAQPFDGMGYVKLADYFESVTHEYAKALEVLNKGLKDNYNRGKFREMFKARQDLLTKIAAENHWEKLCG